MGGKVPQSMKKHHTSNNMMITDDQVGNGESILILNIKEYIQNDESFIILGALNAMMAVGTGAFGAHGLEDKLSDKYMSIWEKQQLIKCIMD